MPGQLLASDSRHWTWADRIREFFDFNLRTDLPQLSEDFVDDPSVFTCNTFTSMCLWYGLLYVTCDGIAGLGRTLKILPQRIRAQERISKISATRCFISNHSSGHQDQWTSLPTLR